MSLYLGKEKIPGVNIGQAGEQKAVLYEPQTLTQSQQKQARNNIGIDVDPELSSISKNPVENQVIFKSLEEKADLIYVNNNFANALKETMSGPAVATDMVSPIEHEVECKVESANAIPIPYDFEAKTTKGVTIEVQPDGGLKITGKPVDGIASFVIRNSSINLPFGVWTASGCNLPANELRFLPVYIRKNGSVAYPVQAGGKSVRIETEEFRQLLIEVHPGYNQPDGYIMYPMINKGDIALPHTPYVPDLTAVTVSRYGKNLFDGAIENGTIDPVDGTLVPGSSPRRSANFIPVMPNTNYTISRNKYTNNMGVVWVVGYDLNKAGVTDGKILSDVKSGIGVIQDIETEQTFQTTPTTHFIKFYNTSIDLKPEYKHQVELGAKATEIVPCEKTDYTPIADGTVSGMTSLSPNMTILTDNPGVNIEAKYNADTKKYIDKKFEALNNAVLSMGGNI